MTTKASIIQPGEEPKVPYQAEIPVVEATPMGSTPTQQTPSFSAALDTPLNDTPNKDSKTNTNNKPNDGLTDMERFEKEQNRKTMIVVAIVCFFVILGAVIAALKSA